MMAAKGAIKPVTKLMADAGEPFDPKAYLPAITGYYSDTKGNMLSFPFNSSTVGALHQQGRLQEGRPRSRPGAEDLEGVERRRAAAQGARARTAATPRGWPSWMHIENFSAWHNVPIGTKENGIGGIDTELQINSPLHVKHLTMLGDMSKKGLFTYAGRTNQAEAKFASGECAILTSSTGAHGERAGRTPSSTGR